MVQVRLRLLGSGKILAAQVVPRPDKIGMMQKMAKMDMKRAHALKYRPKKDERFKIKEEYGMQMDMSKDPAMKGMDMNHSKMEGMEKDDIAEANGYAQGSCKGRNGNGSF
jgi:hypothetical protein